MAKPSQSTPDSVPTHTCRRCCLVRVTTGNPTRLTLSPGFVTWQPLLQTSLTYSVLHRALMCTYGCCSLVQPDPPSDVALTYADTCCHFVQLGLLLVLMLTSGRDSLQQSTKVPLPALLLDPQLLHLLGVLWSSLM